MSTETAHQQATLQEFEDVHGEQQERCQAIAEYTGEPCRRQPIPGVGYCADHITDLSHDLTDSERTARQRS